MLEARRGYQDYRVEFKELGQATNREGYGRINIKVFNVSCEKLSNVNKDYIKELFELEWIINNKEIFWFDDNNARMREEALEDLLEK